MIRRSRDLWEVRGDLEQQRADEVGQHGRRGRAALADVAARDLDRDAVGRARPRAWRRPTSGSTSQASTGAQPSLAAAIASTPLPQPQSASAPSGSSVASSSKVSRVVACEPVPNAWPGSITTSSVPSAAAPRAAGRAGRRPVDRLVEARQSSPQPSGSSRVETSISAPPTAARTSPSVGQLARRAVEHVLDRVARLALLQPAGRERHQLGQDEVGVLAPDADDELDHGVQHQRRPALELAPLGRPASAGRARWPARKPEAIRRPATSLAGHAVEQREREVGEHRRRDRRARSSRRRTPRRRRPRCGARCGARRARAAGSSSTPRPARSRAAPPRSPARRCPRPNRQRARPDRAPAAAPGTAASSGATAAPKDGPGSMTRSSGEPSSHGGRIVKPPTVTGVRCACQADAQPESTAERTRSSTTSPASSRTASSEGSGRRRPRTRRHRRARPPRRRAPARLQAGEGEFGVVGPDPDAEPDSPGQRPLELGDHALVLAQVVLRQRVRELLQEVLLLAASGGAG